MRIILSLIVVALLTGCASLMKNHGLAQVVQAYFDTYAKRESFNEFMTFYDDGVQFEDIIYGNHFETKAEVKQFLDWNRGEFKALSGRRILTITKQVIEGNSVITQGFFHEFSYDGQKLGPWLFIIAHEFNSLGKIVKQTDWINYTPRKGFLGGNNMNKALINN